MVRHLRRSRVGVALLVLGSWAWAGAGADAVETEVRDFTVEIEGKAAGQYTMTITKQNDGILSVQNQANISFKHLLGTYTYTFQGVEHWKDGKLLQLTSKCSDDGNKYDVSANADRDVLRLKVNGKDRNCRGDAWTTSYWMMADKRFHNNQVPLLDADTGKELVAQLQYVGVEQTSVGGQQQNCYHFRVTGGPATPTDLWFDGQHRLVRQEFTEQNRKVIFVLRSVRRAD